MGERYWISGVQLGMLKAAVEWDQKGTALVLIDDILDKQFVGNTNPYPSEVEKS